MTETIVLEILQSQMEKLAQHKEIITSIRKFIENGKLNKEDKKQNEFIIQHFELLTKNENTSNIYKRAKKRLITFCEEYNIKNVQVKEEEEETKTKTIINENSVTRKEIVINQEIEETSERNFEIDPFKNENLSLVDQIKGKRINKNSTDTDISMSLYSLVDLCSLLVESYKKIEKLRIDSDLLERKKKKMESLTLTVEAMTEYQSASITMQEVIDQKFTQILGKRIS
jgi:subtilase family serine protease